MAERYYINLCRKEIARVSYFPALEIKNKPKAEWIARVLIPLLLPIARRKNKKIMAIPITFWMVARHTARSFPEELFLFMTPADPGAVARQIIEAALQNIQDAKIFAGLEPIADVALPVCQIFRGKLIRFYYGAEGVAECCLPAFKWSGHAPALALSDIAQSATLLEKKNSEILFMRANIKKVMNGEYYRKFQQALDCIGIKERD